jgi:hypothetical protein
MAAHVCLTRWPRAGLQAAGQAMLDDVLDMYVETCQQKTTTQNKDLFCFISNVEAICSHCMNSSWKAGSALKAASVARNAAQMSDVSGTAAASSVDMLRELLDPIWARVLKSAGLNSTATYSRSPLRGEDGRCRS